MILQKMAKSKQVCLAIFTSIEPNSRYQSLEMEMSGISVKRKSAREGRWLLVLPAVLVSAGKEALRGENKKNE